MGLGAADINRCRHFGYFISDATFSSLTRYIFDRKVCRDTGLPVACKEDEDCPHRDLNACKSGICALKPMSICQADGDCEKGLKCVYGPEGMIRVCKKDQGGNSVDTFLA